MGGEGLGLGQLVSGQGHEFTDVFSATAAASRIFQTEGGDQLGSADHSVPARLLHVALSETLTEANVHHHLLSVVTRRGTQKRL